MQSLKMHGLVLLGCLCLVLPGVRSGETCYDGVGGNLGTGDRASGHNLQWTKVEKLRIREHVFIFLDSTPLPPLTLAFGYLLNG